MYKIGNRVRATRNDGPITRNVEYTITKTDGDFYKLDDIWWVFGSGIMLVKSTPVILQDSCCNQPLTPIPNEDMLHGECLICGNIFLKDGDVLRNTLSTTSQQTQIPNPCAEIQSTNLREPVILNFDLEAEGWYETTQSIMAGATTRS